MAHASVILLCLTLATALAFPTAKEAELVTEPKPGDEFVFVQSTDVDARPISRKDKFTDETRPFETSHKVPSSLTFARKQGEVEKKPIKPTKPVKHVQKREASPQGAAPAPAGAIKLDVRALLKKYETELKTSTTPKPKSPSTTTKSARRRGGSKRVKKEAKQEAFQVTSPSPVLTTAKNTPKKVDDDDDIPILGAASEKQRSRIQIKKGPNGQEYEYEYVYYYYDDEEDSKDKKVTNAHDGPARNQITRGDKTREKTTPEVNEVVPSRGAKTRGRQLGEEEAVGEERLPANTRFPPRSRNLNTTPIPEEETTKAVTRGRGRGRPTTEAAPNESSDDSVSDETQGTRGRTRANVRRPSLDLVDSDSFNTHSASSGKPAFPQELPEGPEEGESEDKEEIAEPKGKDKDEKDEEGETSSPTAEEGTTVMSAMDKVALDLYAISQGTQKLFGEGEDSESSTDSEKSSSTEENEATTEPITETPEPETTTVTTTTTTTTTTPAPTTTTTTTTTTTEAAPFGRGKFGGRRGGLGGRKTTSHSSTTTEAAQTESKPKGKFGRPSFGGRSRPGGKTTAAPAVEEESHKEESKPVSHSRPSLNRGRFGASRPRGRTTAATEEPKDESSSSSTSAPSQRPSLPRARPSFNLRTRGRTTAAPATEEDQSNEEASPSTEASSSTTAKGRRIAASGVRPLRPGPRINLAARGRPGAATTTTTTEAPVEDQVAEAEEEHETPDQEASEKEETPAAPVDNSPLGRLRNKNRINVQNRPKAAASAPVQVRRVNPLLARRRPGQTTEAPSSEAPQESAATEAESADEESTEAAPSSSTTEEPKGLNKLLAGRRRPGVRTPGTLAHRT